MYVNLALKEDMWIMLALITAAGLGRLQMISYSNPLMNPLKSHDIYDLS